MTPSLRQALEGGEIERRTGALEQWLGARTPAQPNGHGAPRPGAPAVTSRLARRIDAVEAEARRLLPAPEAAADSAEWVCGWLSSGELERLAHMVERAESGEAIEGSGSWAAFRRRALARALLDVDVAELDRQERASRLLLTFDHPDHPHDRMRVIYVDYTEDLVERGVWHMVGAHRAQHSELPATLTAAELAPHDPRPWPPSPAGPVA